MSLGLFAEGLSGEAARLPNGMTHLSINQLSKLVILDVHIGDPQNIEKLVWRHSLPVLHRAAACSAGQARPPAFCGNNPPQPEGRLI